jgi:signal peptidase II
MQEVNNLKLKRSHIVFITLFLVLIIDQVSKFYIKLNFEIGDEVRLIGDWARLHFVENEGMAYGITLGDGSIHKLILTVFRLFAVGFIIYYLRKLVLEKSSKGLIFSISLILAGALGNIIDSVFYGVIFNESYGQVAQLFPEGGGYSTWLHGRVVDMFYFPMVDTILPDWIPIFGGQPFSFFKYIFNVADSSISIGVTVILIFQKRFFPKPVEGL